MDTAYTIKRSSKRKKLTITVERDRSVVVHAPESTPEDTIREVVESKRRWIYEKAKHAQKYEERPHPPGKELVNGESTLYLGREYQIELIPTDSTEIRFERHFLIPASLAGRRRQVLRNWYIERAKDMILPKVKNLAAILGVEFASAKIVDNRFRWGSCTVKDNVNLNWRLIKAPMFVINYVIVHELAHLIEANHTPRFWNIVRTHAPTAEKARSWLRNHGEILEHEI